jgi:hypothetical protein
MRRVTRLTTAIALAVAVALLPIVLDRCADACDAHHAAAAKAPACHHTTSTAIHITSAPAPCGHDHHGTIVTAPKSVAPVDRTSAGTAMTFDHVVVAPGAAADVQVRPHSPPPCCPPLTGRSLPLRV